MSWQALVVLRLWLPIEVASGDFLGLIRLARRIQKAVRRGLGLQVTRADTASQVIDFGDNEKRENWGTQIGVLQFCFVFPLEPKTGSCGSPLPL